MSNNYIDKYTRFNIAQGILTNRYMLTALLVNVNNLCYYLEAREKTLRELLPKETRKTIHQDIQYQDTVEFDEFKISGRYFNALSKQFGYDAVSEACVLMTTHIRRNLDKKFSQPQINKKLKEYCIKVSSLNEVNEDLGKAILATKSIDYRLINDEATARQYIKGVPIYMQSLDEGCQYLKERFNL